MWYLDEVQLGTGEYGPVELYVYGTDPNELFGKAAAKAVNAGGRSIRHAAGDAEKAAKTTIPDISYRTLPDNERTRFNVAPSTSPRSDAALTPDDHLGGTHRGLPRRAVGQVTLFRDAVPRL